MNTSSDNKLEEIETRLDNLEKDVLMLRMKTEDQTETIDKIDSKLDSILLEMSKYKGAFGGLMLAASCIWAFVKFVGFTWFQR